MIIITYSCQYLISLPFLDYLEQNKYLNVSYGCTLAHVRSHALSHMYTHSFLKGQDKLMNSLLCAAYRFGENMDR